MLVLDFINVGNGDSMLIREMEGGEQRFAMLVDCGHDKLERDDHPPLNDARSCRIFAGDFLRQQGVSRLDLLVLTHFHRDHIGGLGRVLEAVT
ncbi:MAG: MBL fold metallo-hydrolase, partial [Oscillibacter sp.]